jgi:hypothetical protein
MANVTLEVAAESSYVQQNYTLPLMIASLIIVCCVAPLKIVMKLTVTPWLGEDEKPPKDESSMRCYEVTGMGFWGSLWVFSLWALSVTDLFTDNAYLFTA